MKSFGEILRLCAHWIIGSRIRTCRRLLRRTTWLKQPILLLRERIIRLRWFTPQQEVDLCGHATLASAYVIFHYLKPEVKVVTFDSQSGPLYVTRESDLLCLDFPARAPVACSVSETLAGALGRPPREILCSRDYLAIYDTEDEVRALQPDFEKLKTLDRLGVIVTAPGRTSDFVSRFFAPGARHSGGSGDGLSSLHLDTVLGKAVGQVQAACLASVGARAVNSSASFAAIAY